MDAMKMHAGEGQLAINGTHALKIGELKHF